MNVYIQIIIGIILADFLSGLFHWFEDNYIDYCTNIPLFKDIGFHNELHHYFPRSMLAYSYWDNMSVTFILSILTIGIIYYMNSSLVIEYKYLFGSLFIFGSTANIFHRFSHMRECELPSLIHFLQKYKIIISHTDHSYHHHNTDDSYCTIIPYTNYLLDEMKFWRLLEYIIYACTSIKPAPKKAYNDYKSIYNYMHLDNKSPCPKIPSLKDVEILGNNLDNFYKCHVNINDAS